jgi:integrase
MRIVRMGYLQRKIKRDKKGRVTSANLQVRIVVPDELQWLLPPPHTGKQELIRALGTGNDAEANRLSLPIIAEFLRVLDQARAVLNPVKVNHVRVPLAPLKTETKVITTTVTRGGFGSRIVPEDEAKPIVAEQLRPVDEPVAAIVNGERVTFASMVAAWARERKIPPRTERLMLSKADRFADFLGHDDMGRVSRDDLIRYKVSMLKPETGYSHRTIKHHLDDLKTLFRYAAANRNIADPTIGFKFTYRDDGRSQWRPYTPDERIRILTNAREATSPVIRWCQWIAWATGARISEIAECHTSDIYEMVPGMWVIRISLENREATSSLKNEASHRIVPLHPVLIEEGLLDYVRSLPAGPLFPELIPNRDGKRGDPASRRISKWMRHKLKIEDKRIAPNHSWRHTFETIHRNELDPSTREDIVNHITGHSNKNGSSGRKYGVFEVTTDKRDIERMVCPI